MSAISTITIADGESTPVTHNFLPVASGPESFWREAVSGVPLIGQPTVSAKMVSKPSDAVQKVIVTSELPVLEVVTGQNAAGYSAAPKIAYTVKKIETWFLPARATAQQKKNLRILANNLNANAQLIDLIENLATPY